MFKNNSEQKEKLLARISLKMACGAWEKLWKKAALDLAEKHRRIFELFQSIRISEHRHEAEKDSR